MLYFNTRIFRQYYRLLFDKYSFENVQINRESVLFNGLGEELPFWLNKEYVFNTIPKGFSEIGNHNGNVVAIENREKKICGLLLLGVFQII